MLQMVPHYKGRVNNDDDGKFAELSLYSTYKTYAFPVFFLFP